MRTCTYDYLGHLLTETDANGNTTTYTYNKLGKVKTKTYPSDETIALLTETYFYDKNGNVAKVSKNTGKTTTYTYNNQGAVDPQVKQQVTTQGSESITLSWRYDYLGNCVEETDANGVVTGYTFDSMNRLVATTYAKGTDHEKQTSATYDKNGNQLTQTNEYGNTKTNEYDAMDRRCGPV